MYKVLIVDDELKIREGLAKVIDWKENDFIVIAQAGDGREALDIYNEKKPSLVVTDIKMPEMDGLELIAQLKKINPNVNIIILSGYDDFEYAKKAIKYGVDSYILKPVDEMELCAELGKIKQRIESRLTNKKLQSKKEESLRNYYFLKLINGGLNEQEALKEANACNVEFAEGTSYCVCLIDIYLNEKANTDEKQDDTSLESFAAGNIIEEIIERTKRGYLFEYSKNRFGIITQCKENINEFEDLINTLEEILSYISSLLNINANAAIGSTVKSLVELKESYNSAVSLMINGHINNSTAKVFYKKNTGQAGEILEILRYIEKNYSQDLSIKKLAQIFYMNSAYFGQLFRKETGEYCHEYVNKIRVDNAKRMLEDNVLNINMISELVGYKYIDHFYRNFKTYTGMSPLDYRKKYNNL